MHAALISALVCAATPSATDALKQRDTEMRAALPAVGQPVTETQREKAEDLLIKIVDFHAIAQKALGKTWESTPEAKRKRFEDAFVKRFKRATSDQVDRYRTAQVTYNSEQKAGDDVKVITTVGAGDDAATVAYVMRQGAKGWLIEDIVIDDVDNVENYRKSFAKVIDKDGLDGLIAKLEKAPATTDGGSAATP